MVASDSAQILYDNLDYMLAGLVTKHAENVVPANSLLVRKCTINRTPFYQKREVKTAVCFTI